MSDQKHIAPDPAIRAALDALPRDTYRGASYGPPAEPAPIALYRTQLWALTRAELRTLEDAAETEERLAQAETQEATARAHRASMRAHLAAARIAEIDERPEDAGCDLGGAYFYADLAEHHEGYAAGYRKSYEERLATLARRERTRESAVDAGKPAAVRAIGDLTALTEAQRDGRACIRCGGEDGAMLPAGVIDGVQVFVHERCASSTTTFEPYALGALGDAAVAEPSVGHLLGGLNADDVVLVLRAETDAAIGRAEGIVDAGGPVQVVPVQRRSHLPFASVPARPPAGPPRRSRMARALDRSVELVGRALAGQTFELIADNVSEDGGLARELDRLAKELKR